MKLLSKASYYKIHWLATKIEIRSTMNVLGLCSDRRAEQKNKEDFYKVATLYKNLGKEEKEKFDRHVQKNMVEN